MFIGGYMKKRGYQMNIGGASILLLLLVFALTVFAILSMRASYQELKMSEKTRDAVERYYQADVKSEETLMSVREIMRSAMEQSLMSEIEYLKEEIAKDKNLKFDENSHVLTCLVSVDYNKSIETRLKIPKEFSKDYEILSHKMIVDEQEDYENEGIDIWDGIIDN